MKDQAITPPSSEVFFYKTKGGILFNILTSLLYLQETTFLEETRILSQYQRQRRAGRAFKIRVLGSIARRSQAIAARHTAQLANIAARNQFAISKLNAKSILAAYAPRLADIAKKSAVVVGIAGTGAAAGVASMAAIAAGEN